MENKKSNLKRSLGQIRELFEDVEKLESIIESVSSEKEIENISLAGNAIINSLVVKLKDVDNSLRSSYSERMKRKLEKVLKRAQQKYDKEQMSEEWSCSDDGPLDKLRKRNNIDKEPSDGSLIGVNGQTVLSKGSIENGNPSSEQRFKQESFEKVLTHSLDRNSNNEKPQKTENPIESSSSHIPSKCIEDGNSNDNLDENSHLEKSDISDNDKLSSKECTELNTLATTRDSTSDDDNASSLSNEVLAETSEDDSKVKSSKEQGNQIGRYRSDQSNDDKSDDSEVSDASNKKLQKKKKICQPDRDVSESGRGKSGKKKSSDKKKSFAKKNDKELSKNKKQFEKSSDSSEDENDKIPIKKSNAIREKSKSINYEDVAQENSSDDTFKMIENKKISATGNIKYTRWCEEQSKSDSDNTEINNEKEIAKSTIRNRECVEEPIASSKENGGKDADVESAACNSLEKDTSKAKQGGDENTLEDSGDATTSEEINKEKTNERLVETTENDSSGDKLDEVVDINDQCLENNEKPNASVESETTILLDDPEHNGAGASNVLAENVRKEANKVGDFPISLEQLDQAIDSYLSTSQGNELKPFEDEEAPNEHEHERTLPDSVILTELNPNLVVIDDDSEDDKQNEENNLKSLSLVGKINVVDLKKLIMSENIDISEESAKGLPERPKIRVASFARISKFNEAVSSKEQVGETNKEEDKEDNKIIGKRLKNPHAQKLNQELLKLKEVRNNRLETVRLLNEKHKLENELKLKLKKRKEKERILKKQQTSTKQKEEKSKRATQETFAIPNNRPILLVPVVPKEPSDQVMYSIAKPEELDDKKLLDRCVVCMMARQTPETLQLNYNIKQQRLEDEKEQLGVTMSCDDDDDDVASDGDSDSSLINLRELRLLLAGGQYSFR